MKRLIIVLSVMFVAVLLMIAPVDQANADPIVSIELLNPPPDGLLQLEIGESRTFDILITSSEHFVLAMVVTDAYYPGRGVFWHGGERATHGISALLHLTITGKNSTSDLLAVCDWPEPGTCWYEGVAPVLISAGVRFKGGVVVAENFPISVVVP
jgi:hypothetical protein